MKTIHQETPLHAVVDAKVPPFRERSFNGAYIQGIAMAWPIYFALIHGHEAGLVDVCPIDGDAFPFTIGRYGYGDRLGRAL